MKWLHRESVTIAFLVLTLGVFTAGLGHRAALLQSDSLAAVYAEVLVQLTNKDRDKSDLKTLVVNPVLEEAARLKAEDMASKGYFAHYSPDGTAPWDWMKKAGYDFVYAGENLAVNFTDSGDVEKAWMKSPTHRANILNDLYSEIGIATAVGTYKGKEAIFVVQMFGEPKVKPVAITNPASVGFTDALTGLLTNPSTVVMLLYTLMFIFVSVSMVCIIFSEYRKHHLRHMLFSILLLVVIVSLAWIYRTELPALIIA